MDLFEAVVVHLTACDLLLLLLVFPNFVSVGVGNSHLMILALELDANGSLL